jgi:hypothetical protein
VGHGRDARARAGTRATQRTISADICDSGSRVSLRSPGARELESSPLRRHARDEDRERGELLLDEVARGFVLDLAGLLVELGGAIADEDFRLVEREGSRNAIALRRSYCTRAPPTGPGDADCSATGLPAKGWLGSRETQSMAFFSPPGMEKLYSGVQKITPSAARMASASKLTGAGKPVEFCISAL